MTEVSVLPERIYVQAGYADVTTPEASGQALAEAAMLAPRFTGAARGHVPRATAARVYVPAYTYRGHGGHADLETPADRFVFGGVVGTLAAFDASSGATFPEGARAAGVLQSFRMTIASEQPVALRTEALLLGFSSDGEVVVPPILMTGKAPSLSGFSLSSDAFVPGGVRAVTVAPAFVGHANAEIAHNAIADASAPGFVSQGRALSGEPYDLSLAGLVSGFAFSGQSDELEPIDAVIAGAIPNFAGAVGADLRPPIDVSLAGVLATFSISASATVEQIMDAELSGVVSAFEANARADIPLDALVAGAAPAFSGRASAGVELRANAGGELAAFTAVCRAQINRLPGVSGRPRKRTMGVGLN